MIPYRKKVQNANQELVGVDLREYLRYSLRDKVFACQQTPCGHRLGTPPRNVSAYAWQRGEVLRGHRLGSRNRTPSVFGGDNVAAILRSPFLPLLFRGHQLRSPPGWKTCWTVNQRINVRPAALHSAFEARPTRSRTPISEGPR